MTRPKYKELYLQAKADLKYSRKLKHELLDPIDPKCKHVWTYDLSKEQGILICCWKCDKCYGRFAQYVGESYNPNNELTTEEIQSITREGVML